MFEPKGDVPQWRLIYDLAIVRAPDDLITYEEIENVLGYDVQTGHRSPIYKASKHLLEDHQRTLVAELNRGYRIARADEHYTLAKGQQKGARRKIRRGVALSTHVDLAALTPRQRGLIEDLNHVLMAQNAMLARHDTRIGDVEKDTRRIDDRVDVLEATLAKHGITVPQSQTVKGEVVEET